MRDLGIWIAIGEGRGSDGQGSSARAVEPADRAHETSCSLVEVEARCTRLTCARIRSVRERRQALVECAPSTLLWTVRSSCPGCCCCRDSCQLTRCCSPLLSSLPLSSCKEFQHREQQVVVYRVTHSLSPLRSQTGATFTKEQRMKKAIGGEGRPSLAALCIAKPDAVKRLR